MRARRIAPAAAVALGLLAVFLLLAAPAGDFTVLDFRVHHGTLPLGWVAVAVVADTRETNQ